MSTFLLVHGGGHRGWHWHRLRAELERRGHGTAAPDVPMEDPAAGAGDWADVIVEAGRDCGSEDIVLVGHSLAGLALPIVAERMPLRRMVFLCANVPQPGMSYEEYLRLEPDAVIVPPATFDERGRLVVSWETARERYYPDCDEWLARAAFRHLLPSAALIANQERCPVDVWPDVRTSSIFCAEDRVIGPAWSRRVSLERLGGPAIEMPGGHSPQLSRPRALADVLESLLDDPPYIGGGREKEASDGLLDR